MWAAVRVIQAVRALKSRGYTYSELGKHLAPDCRHAWSLGKRYILALEKAGIPVYEVRAGDSVRYRVDQKFSL